MCVCVCVRGVILDINSQFHDYKESIDKKRSQFLINGLSKNSYTMYSDCLDAYHVQTVDDNYNCESKMM